MPLPTFKPPAIYTLLLKLESPTACNRDKILLEPFNFANGTGSLPK